MYIEPTIRTIISLLPEKLAPFSNLEKEIAVLQLNSILTNTPFNEPELELYAWKQLKHNMMFIFPLNMPLEITHYPEWCIKIHIAYCEGFDAFTKRFNVDIDELSKHPGNLTHKAVSFDTVPQFIMPNIDLLHKQPQALQQQPKNKVLAKASIQIQAFLIVCIMELVRALIIVFILKKVFKIELNFLILFSVILTMYIAVKAINWFAGTRIKHIMNNPSKYYNWVINIYKNL